VRVSRLFRVSVLGPLVLLGAAGSARCQITNIQCNQVGSDNGAIGRRPTFDNRVLGCNLWTLEWYASGGINFGPQVELDGAIDNNGTPGTWVTTFFSPSSLNANPIGLQAGIIVLHGYAPWISVNLNNNFNVTSFSWILRGLYSQTPEGYAMTMAQFGGAGLPIQQCDNMANVSVPLGTTVRVVAANASALFTHICAFSLGSSTAGSTATLGLAATGNCAVGITFTYGTFALAAGVPVSLGSGLGSLANGSNSFDVCVAALVGNVTGTISFNQNNLQ
jgi:hypothetical protein